MKVLHIVTRIDEGGISSFLYNYYKNMDRDKVKFEIVAIETEYKQGYHEIFEGLGIVIYYMPNRLIQRLFYLFSLIRHRKYDIVHCHIELYSSVYLTVAALAGVKVRVAHTHLAINTRTGFKSELLRFWLNRIATMKFGASEKAINELFGEKYKNQATIVYNAINIEEYSFNENDRDNCRRDLNLGDKFIVGFVGRLTHLKNIPYVIDVFYSLFKKHPNTILLLVGSGELKEQLLNKVESLGIKESVIFLGSRSDINHLMMAMDVLLLPSFNEGLGMVLIEAQAASLKCIASLGRVPEETNISFYIHYRDIEESHEEWADFIEKECSSYERKPLNDETRVNRFNIKLEAKQLSQLYEGALGN